MGSPEGWLWQKSTAAADARMSGPEHLARVHLDPGQASRARRRPRTAAGGARRGPAPRTPRRGRRPAGPGSGSRPRRPRPAAGRVPAGLPATRRPSSTAAWSTRGPGRARCPAAGAARAGSAWARPAQAPHAPRAGRPPARRRSAPAGRCPAAAPPARRRRGVCGPWALSRSRGRSSGMPGQEAARHVRLPTHDACHRRTRHAGRTGATLGASRRTPDLPDASVVFALKTSLHRPQVVLTCLEALPHPRVPDHLRSASSIGVGSRSSRISRVGRARLRPPSTLRRRTKLSHRSND